MQYLPKKGLYITEPKTEKSRRTIKLPDFVYDALCEHLDRMEQNNSNGHKNRMERNPRFLFTTSTGNPFFPRNFTRSFKDLTAEAGLPKIRLHDLPA